MPCGQNVGKEMCLMESPEILTVVASFIFEKTSTTAKINPEFMKLQQKKKVNITHISVCASGQQH